MHVSSFIRTSLITLAMAIFARPAMATQAPAPAQALPSTPTAEPVLLLFAHPDDEIIVAPLAAGLARRGIPVVLAYATAGENGAPSDGSIKAGAPIGAVRRDEARCSAAALGIAPPRFLGFIDGSLGEAMRPAWKRLAAVTAAVKTLVDEVHPRAVVTWGPDGGYGHPDHRLISAVASEVLLGSAYAAPLLYVGLPADVLAAHPPRVIAWAGVDPALLTVAVPFTDADAAASRRAVQCHRTQFQTDAVVNAVIADLTPVIAGKIHLRPARPVTPNLFD